MGANLSKPNFLEFIFNSFFIQWSFCFFLICLEKSGGNRWANIQYRSCLESRLYWKRNSGGSCWWWSWWQSSWAIPKLCSDIFFYVFIWPMNFQILNDNCIKSAEMHIWCICQISIDSVMSRIGSICNKLKNFPFQREPQIRKIITGKLIITKTTEVTILWKAIWNYN